MTNTYSYKQIMDYGKSHGYSPKEISKVVNANKDKIVSYGINTGYKGSDINKVLNEYGYSNYNPLTAKANWENLLPNLAQGAKEFARDMRTMGGVVVQPFVDVANTPTARRKEVAKQKFAEAIKNDALRRTALGAGVGATVGSKLGLLGTAGGLITGGLVGLLGPKGVANAALQTYDTSTEDIGQAMRGKKSWGDVAADVTQGAMRNPLYSGLDVLSLGGAKALGKAGRAVGNAVPADAPMWAHQLFQSSAMRDFNRAATNAIQNSKARTSQYVEPLEKLNATLNIDNLELAKNLILNEGNLTGKNLELAENIKKSIRGLENKLDEYKFLDKNMSRSNVVAQYGMQKLMPVIPDVLHRDIVNYIDTGKMSSRIAEATTKNPEIKTYLDKVIKEGENLYDKDKTAFVTQALTSTEDPRGEVIASSYAKQGDGYFGTTREIGRAKLEDIAEKLPESLAYQQRQSLKALESTYIMDDLLSQPGLAEQIKDVNNIPKGKTVINPRLLRENIGKALNAGSDIDMRQILKRSDIPELGAYLIPNVYFKALDNMFAPIKGSNSVMNAFKKTVLASPHWFALNRVGNWTNNSMGGVTPVDYLDAVKYKKLMPKQLKAQTSFNSYVGDNSIGFKTSITTPMKKLATEAKRLAKSDKSLEDMGRAVEQALANTSDIFTNPIFRMEASAEGVDRFANMIRQAKREAEATKGNWQDIIKKADSDSALYNKLNAGVNSDLGDYIGRNYLIPNSTYKFIGAMAPFYRFLSQTGRTTFHQLADHGMAFQSTVMNPAKTGKQFSEDVIQQMGLDPETYEGGIPYAQQPDGSWRYIGMEPLPAGAVIGDLLSTSNKLNLVAPQWSMVGDIARYSKGEGWTPSSAGLTEYKLTHGTSKGYEPTLGERVGYGLSELANTFYAPVRTSRGWGKELLNTITGKPTLSNYDANVLQDNPLSYARALPIETFGKWAGIQNRAYYPKFVTRPKKLTKSKIKKINTYKRQIQENTRGK